MTRNPEQHMQPDQLMHAVAQQKGDYAAAEKAFETLYDIYNPFVIQLCKKYYAYYRIREADFWQEIAGNVLATMWEKAHTYKPDKDTGEKKSFAKADLQLRKWLKTIVRNEYLKFLREKQSKELYYTPSEAVKMNNELLPHLSVDIVDYIQRREKNRMFVMTSMARSEISAKTGKLDWLVDELPDITENEALAEEGKAAYTTFLQQYGDVLQEAERLLAKMSEKKREVFLSYIIFQDESGRMPSDIHQSLCKEYGLHREYLKDIKRTVAEQLRKGLEKKFGVLISGE